jgi:phosphoribosylformylglycinamidine synthase
MWQFSESVDGMADACRALGIPVIGGNVSFYNESRGRDIDPTPIVGVLGLVDRLDRRPPGVDLAPGSQLLLVGPDAEPAPGAPSGLAGSRLAWGRGLRGGALPELDLGQHAAVAGAVRELVLDGWLTGAHDLADGGLALVLGELVARSNLGVRLTAPDGAGAEWLFREIPSRVLVCVDAARADDVVGRLAGSGVPVRRVGSVEGDRLAVTDASAGTLVDVAAAEVVDRWRRALPDLLASGTTQG